MTFDEKYDFLIQGYEKSKVDDVINAICVADDLYGSNERVLNYHKFLERKLPAVQMMRVKCDAVIILSESKEVFCNPESVRVSDGKAAGYASAEDCEKCMIRLYSHSQDYKELIEMCRKFDDLIKSAGIELPMRSIRVPSKIAPEVHGGYYDFSDDVDDSGVLNDFLVQCSELLMSCIHSVYDNGSILGLTKLNSIRQMLKKHRLPLYCKPLKTRNKLFRDMQSYMFSQPIGGTEDTVESYLSLIRFLRSDALLADSFGLVCRDGKVVFEEAATNGKK